jgi:hypothetical protein
MPAKQPNYRKSEARLKVSLLRAQILWTYLGAAAAFSTAFLTLIAAFQMLRHP